MRALFLLPCFLLLLGCHSKPVVRNKAQNAQIPEVVIAIQPLGKVELHLVEQAQKAINSVYFVKTVVLPPLQLPAEAFVKIKSPRYRADKLIAWIRQNRPDSVDYVIGITASDISTTKTDALGRTLEPRSRYEDFGIFGLGYQPGPACVVSTFRLKSDAQKFVSRFSKVVVHELGHNLGLPHCPNKGCFMADAVETITSVDKEEMRLCAACQQQLATP